MRLEDAGDGGEMADSHDLYASIQARVREAFLPFRWSLLGFALCRAWTPALLSFTASSMWDDPVSVGLQTVVYLCATMASLGIAFGLGRLRPSRRDSVDAPASIAMSALGVLGAATIGAGMALHLFPLAVVGFALAGLSAGYYEVIWGRRFVSLSNTSIQAYTLLLVAVAAALGAVMGFLPVGTSVVLFGLFPVVIGTLYLAGAKATGPSSGVPQAVRQGSETSEASGRRGGTNRRWALYTILLSVLLFSVFYNLIIELVYDYLPSDVASQNRFVANLVTAGALLVFSLVLRPLTSTALFRLILPITAVGFVLYLLSPESLGGVALVVSSMGRKLFDILTWVLVAQAVRSYAFNADGAFGLLIAGKQIGYVSGLLVAQVVLHYAPGVTQIVTVVPIGLLVLIVCFFWVFPERTIDQLFGMGGNVGSGNPSDAPAGEQAQTRTSAPALDFDERVRVVAGAYALTPRESQVLGLLARGRTQAVVADKLGISVGTAHTHIAHVYQKLGVNRQQDLIELVEHVEDHQSSR